MKRTPEVAQEVNPDSFSENSRDSSVQWRRLGVLGLAAFAMATCFVGLDAGPALGDHECINALAARQTLESGEWLIPHLAEIPRIRKPPLGIWLIAAASYVMNRFADSATVTDYSARLPSAIAAWGTILLIYWLGRQMYDYRVGLTSGFVAACGLGTILYAHSAQVDMVLTFLTTLSFACFWLGAVSSKPNRWAMIAFYIAFALAMMAKAPLPLVTVGFSLAVYWFITVPLQMLFQGNQSVTTGALRTLRHAIWIQFKRLSRLWLIPGIFLFVLLAGAWPLYVYAHIDRALALWRIEYIDRFTGDMSKHSQPLLYYIPVLFGLTTPFLLSLPEAVAAPFMPRHRSYRKGLAFAFTWAIVGTCFLSLSSYKRPHYVLSLLPAYCLLLGPVIARLFFGNVVVSKRAVQATCRLIPMALATVAVAGAVLLNQEYPGLVASYMLGTGTALILWIAASRSFARDHRIVSFAEMNLGVLVVLLAIWPGLREGFKMNPEGDALAEALSTHNVQRDDPIFWVDGRPDSSVEFYSGFRVRRLINEIEMTSIRANRKTLSVHMYQEFARRIRQQLEGPKVVYLIMSSEHLEMLQRYTDIDPLVLLRLEGFHEVSGDELVVVTQASAPHPPNAGGKAT